MNRVRPEDGLGRQTRVVAMTQLAEQIEQQRRILDISVSQTAKLANVSRATVTRMLNGEIESCSLASITAVCNVLGLEIGITNRMDRAPLVAKQKAEKIARLARGNCSLENQSVGDDTFARTVDRLTIELLVGSRRRLWA